MVVAKKGFISVLMLSIFALAFAHHPANAQANNQSNTNKRPDNNQNKRPEPSAQGKGDNKPGKAPGNRVGNPALSDGPERLKENNPDSTAPAMDFLTTVAINQMEYAVDDLKDVDNLYDSLPIANSIIRKLAPHNKDLCKSLVESLFDKFVKQVEGENGKLMNGSRSLKYGSVYKKQLQDIVSIAAIIDPELSRSYISRFADMEMSSAITNKSEMSLSLAKDLVDDSPSRAATIAESSLGEAVTYHSLEFLGRLRQKDPALAKSYFISLLHGVESRKLVSVNEMFYLYSYVTLSKRIPAYVSGQLTFLANVDYGEGLEKLTVDVDLIREYVKVAARIILGEERSSLYSSNASTSVDALSDLIFIDVALLPSMKYLTGDPMSALFNSLAERKKALAAMLDPESYRRAKESADRFNAPAADAIDSTQTGDGKESILGEGDEKYSQDKKDQMRFETARRLVGKKKYAESLEALDKISSKAIKSQARGLILFDIAQAEIKDGRLEEARRWILEDGDLTRRAYALTQITSYCIEKDGKTEAMRRVEDLLTEISNIAAGLPSGIEKVAVLSGMTVILSKFDKARASDCLRSCVQAANEAEKFIGRATINIFVQINGFYYGQTLYKDFGFNDAFTQFGSEYFDRTLAAAKGLSNKLARAIAVTAVCGAVLQRAQRVAEARK
ncbi:MAG TPA: hypothetical protein VFV58_09415 [Blastocatellia bacterium]|jgi:hypothetical protein|nr:hypothetical protein [Blastocatellia bacterium]